MIHICMTGTLKLMDNLNTQQITDTEFREELVSNRKHLTFMRNNSYTSSYVFLFTLFLFFTLCL